PRARRVPPGRDGVGVRSDADRSTIQNISVTLLNDGSFTVAFVGTDFRLSVPGAGIAFGSVRRLLLPFAPDNTLLDVVQDVGDVRSDFSSGSSKLSYFHRGVLASRFRSLSAAPN